MKSFLFSVAALIVGCFSLKSQNCGMVTVFEEAVTDNGNGTSNYTFFVTVKHTSGGDKGAFVNSIKCGAYTFSPISGDPGPCLPSTAAGTIYTFGPYLNVPTCNMPRIINYTGRTTAACGGTTCGVFEETSTPCASADAGADQTACASSPSVTLSGAIGGDATSGTWSGGGGTFNPNSSDLNATYTPSAGEIAAGTVTLTLTTDDPPGDCPAVSDQITITINSEATANAGPNQTVCSSSPTVTLAGTIGGSATSGTWSGGNGTFNPNNSNLNATYTPSAGEIAAGTVTLTLTTDDPPGDCTAVSDQMTITINSEATANAGPDQTVCSSSPAVALAGIIGGSANSGTWSGGNGSFNPNSSDLNATYTPSAGEIAAGTVTLTLTTNPPVTPCIAAFDEMTITINGVATAIAGTDQIVCASSPDVTLAGTIGGTATNGNWSGGSGTYNLNNSDLNATYTPSAGEIAAGMVTLTLTTDDPTGPCPSAADQIAITIDSEATASAGPDQTICTSSPDVTLAGTIGGTATSGTWSGGNGTYDPNNTTLNATYTPTSTETFNGSVTLTLTTDNPTGPCDAASDAVTFTFDLGACDPLPPDPSISNVDEDGDGTPDITDPCSCADPLNYTDGMGNVTYFHDFVIVTSASGETWEVTAIANAFFDEGVTPVPVGHVLTEVSSGVYRFDLFHAPGVPFTVTVDRTMGGPSFPMMTGSTCFPCATPVPTIGQWGLIILSLLILTFGVVALYSSETRLAAVGTNATFSFLYFPLNKAIFSNRLVLVMATVAVVFALAVSLFKYEMTTADVPGSLVAGPLLAYLLHLFSFSNKK